MRSSTIWFAFGTLLSRVSGLIRVSLVLSIFGASKSLDAFFVAFRIPNLFRDMLAEGALSNAFTKVYTDCFEESEEKAAAFFRDALAWVVFAGLCIAVLGVLAAPLLVRLMTMYGSPDAEFIQTATLLTRILFPFLYLMMLGAVFAGTLHHKGRFFLSSVAPLGFNAGYILGAIAFAPLFAAYAEEQSGGFISSFFGLNAAILGLAVGVLVGGLIQTLVYGAKLWNSHIGAISSGRLRLSPEIQKAFWIGVPVALASVAGPINQLVNTNFATSLKVGSITWLDSAFRLFQLPIGLFAVSVGVVILPKLAQSIQRSGQKIEIESQRIAAEGVSLLLLLITPCFLMLFIVGEDICNILYGWGRFSDADVHQTALALQAYSVGLFGYGLIKVLMSIYYAIGRTKFTLVAAAICVGLNAVVNYNLVSSFGHRGLAATSSVVLSIQALLLVGGLYSTGIFSLLKKQKQLRSLVWKTAISVVVLYAVLQYGEPSYLHSLIRACICGSFCAALFWGPFLVQLLKKEGKK